MTDEHLEQARKNGFSYIQGESVPNLPEFVLTKIGFDGLDEVAKENLRRLFKNALDVLDM